MKKVLLFLLIIIFASCSSLKQAQRSINSGNYDNAINLAVKKLRKNKTNKKSKDYILTLQEAYNKAVTKDKEQLTFLKKDNNPDNLERIFNIYSFLDKRQQLIKPLLPLKLYRTNKEAVFNFENYQDQIINSKNKLVEHLYNRANVLLTSSNKMEVRRAYDDLKYINQLNSGYKNTHSLMKEAYAKGTDYVFVAINNETQQVIPQRLENDLLNFDTYRMNDFWTVYQSKKNQNIDYDYRLELNFRKINISPERVTERQLIKEKQIKDGFKYATDKNGKIKKDSLGNKIKIDNFKTIRCELFEFTQRKTCDVVGKVNYVDVKSRQLLESFPISSTFVFEHVYANYDGDKRALEQSFLNLLRLQEVRFPSNEQMIYDTGKDLKEKLKRIITKNRFRN